MHPSISACATSSHGRVGSIPRSPSARPRPPLLPPARGAGGARSTPTSTSTSATAGRADAVAVFSAKPYVRSFLEADLMTAFPASRLTDAHLRLETAPLAAGCASVVAFVNDDLSAPVLAALAEAGVRLVALRCAGYDKVDLAAAASLGVRLTRVPSYSPSSIAEHALALALALNRHIPRAHARAREGDYELSGLVGYEMKGKSVGIVGTGAIGTEAARLFAGIGCAVTAFDVRGVPADLVQAGISPAPDLPSLLASSDIVSLHVPLLPSTRKMMDAAALATLKPGAALINVSRGALVDTAAVTRALEEGRMSGFAADVYEGEASLFFQDWGDASWASRVQRGGWDPVLSYLLSFPK